ncbi:MAG: hypothetical protein MUF45_13780 [Spirosomaceae bacterium]|jgi:hypothetical protein|nr:hypothetical protein [Spirosomataceae bacterium]
MKKAAIFLVIVLVIATTYAYFAKSTPLLPGYHAFFYTPKKYQKVVLQVQNNQSPEKLESNFKKLVPYWYGTRWSFNGTTQKPGDGSIACGYFVTTVLQDLGVQLNRSQLAQLPSEQMIKNLVSTEDIQRFNNTPIFTFLYQVKHSGKGLYVVGLDTHTGFILNDDSGTWFIHSSGAFPFCVVKQEASKAKILADSRYRVLGKLTGNQEFMRKYI